MHDVTCNLEEKCPFCFQDPFSRRSVWELLRSMKQGRVTVQAPSSMRLHQFGTFQDWKE